MSIISKEININNLNRGFHLITDEILKNIPEIKDIKSGILFLFLKHTSASISINENTDITVREDLEEYFKNSVKENINLYKHNYEGSDDMPAHIKSTIIGNNLHIPINNGLLEIGTWQGIYLCEHRNNPTVRKIYITIIT